MYSGNTTRRVALRNTNVNRVLFHAPLRTTLQPKSGQGVATFTRASTAYVEDHEGVLRLAKSGEARFKGARRVENWLPVSEDLSNSAFTKQPGVVVTPLADGVWRVNFSGASVATGVFIQAFNLGVGAIARSSVYIWLEGQSGDGSVIVEDPSNGLWSFTATLTVAKTRYASPAFTLTTANTGIWIKRRAAGATSILVTGWQVESVTGQSNQNLGEYVSSGALSAPYYHGAAVDGVKYFDYANGNTVASNIVTEAQGAPFATSPAFYRDSLSTNLLTQSEDFTNAFWTPNALQGGAATSNVTASPNGLVTADQILDNGANTQHHVRGIVSKAASQITYSLSVYVKPIGRHMLLSMEESTAASGVRAVFDLTSGAVGVAATAFGSGFAASAAFIHPAANGFYRCTLIGVSDTGTQLRCFFRINNSPNSVADVFVGDGSSGLYLWGAQLESLSYPTSYIPTTASQATRNNDVLSWPLLGNLVQRKGTACCRVNAYPDFTRSILNTRLIGTSSSPMYLASGTRAIGFFDGQNVTQTGNSADTVNVAGAVSWGGVVSNASVKGSFASGSFLGSWQSLTSLEIGGAGGGVGFTGTIGDVKVWADRMSASKLQKLTE